MDVEKFKKESKEVFDNEVKPQIANAKMTAVEWLFAQMSNVSAGFVTELNELEMLQQAKQMEKEQCLKMLPYDLEDLATNAANNYDSSGNWHVAYELYKEGFQKAIELLTFKPE